MIHTLTPNFYAALGAFFLAIDCFFLIVHTEYDDGIIGRIALSLIAGCAAIIVMDVYNGHGNFSFHETTAVMVWGVLLFFLRHTHRFLLALQCARCAQDRTGLRRRTDVQKKTPTHA